MAATIKGDRRTDVTGATPFDLGDAESAKSRSRVPEILVGTFLVAIFALGGAWFFSSSTRSVDYLALRQDVARGEVLESDDLVPFRLSTDDPVLGFRAADTELLVGQVALADLKIGTIVTADQFAEQAQIPAGSGIVGLSLEPGEFPSLSLRVGDRVRVVLLPVSGSEVGEPQGSVLIEEAEVAEVVDVGGNGRFVSLTMPAELADQVAVADAGERIRLVQVPRS